MTRYPSDRVPIYDVGRLSRFITVGVTAAGLHFVLTWAFSENGWHPFAAGLTAYLIAFAFAYTAQRNWTFQGKGAHRETLPRYLAAQVACAALSGLATLAGSWLGLVPVAASGAATIAASGASFALSSLWVFPERAEVRDFTKC